MHIRRIAIAVAAIALTAGLLPAGTAAAEVGCAPAEHAGGEWRSYGHDLSNSRTQPLEDTIDPSNVASLEAAFIFEVADADSDGDIQSTPAVVDGCVFAAATDGTVFAANADTGDLVWSTFLPSDGTGLGGAIVGGVTVENGKVYVLVSSEGEPYAAALDQATGDVEWTTTVTTDDGAFTNASPVVFDGMLFFGIAAPESVKTARGGYAFLDAETGELIRHRYTIDEADYAKGYAGASVWTTGVYDPESKSLFVGGGNPASKDIEHEYTNALLEIDADPTSPTFTDIVDAYKGHFDQYYPGLDRQPACSTAPDVNYVAWSATCVQLDLDFGASPNLFRDPRGKLMVGALQKSGVYHTVLADGMQQAWTVAFGAPCFACNAASTAASDGAVYGVGTPGGQLVSTDVTGRYRWVSPVLDGVHFQSTSVANGVVYGVDTKGFFGAYDAETGVPLVHRPMLMDTGSSETGLTSSGVAIARNTVYAAANGKIIAYRLPA